MTEQNDPNDSGELATAEAPAAPQAGTDEPYFYATCLRAEGFENGLVLGLDREQPGRPGKSTSVTVFAWHHAKFLAKHLQALVEVHEQQRGPIPIAEGDARILLQQRAEIELARADRLPEFVPLH